MVGDQGKEFNTVDSCANAVKWVPQLGDVLDAIPASGIWELYLPQRLLLTIRPSYEE